MANGPFVHHSAMRWLKVLAYEFKDAGIEKSYAYNMLAQHLSVEKTRESCGFLWDTNGRGSRALAAELWMTMEKRHFLSDPTGFNNCADCGDLSNGECDYHLREASLLLSDGSHPSNWTLDVLQEGT